MLRCPSGVFSSGFPRHQNSSMSFFPFNLPRSILRTPSERVFCAGVRTDAGRRQGSLRAAAALRFSSGCARPLTPSGSPVRGSSIAGKAGPCRLSRHEEERWERTPTSSPKCTIGSRRPSSRS